jgi:hypothetical protein
MYFSATFALYGRNYSATLTLCNKIFQHGDNGGTNDDSIPAISANKRDKNLNYIWFQLSELSAPFN